MVHSELFNNREITEKGYSDSSFQGEISWDLKTQKHAEGNMCVARGVKP